jgi:CRP/FNR family transcriptional regulator, cyclic AMP receptor protein
MDREEGLRILAGSGWLAQTSEEFRGLFLPMARWRSFAAGAQVTLGGEEADDIIGLASGVMAFTSVLGLPDTPVMHLGRAVYWMGYGPILMGGPRVVSAEARSEVWVASFPKARVLPLLDGTTRWWQYFMRLLGEYGHVNAMIASDLLIPESERRCAAVLLRFGGCRGATTAPVLVPVTQGELAAAANLSRNSAGTILRGWAAQGLIETGYGGITISDPAGLRAVMEKLAA